MPIKVYGGNHGIATRNVVPDNQSVALDIESTDDKDYIKIDTTNGSESIALGQFTKITGKGGATGYDAGAGETYEATLYIENGTANSADRCSLVLNGDADHVNIDMMYQDNTKLRIMARDAVQTIVAEDTLVIQNEADTARLSIGDSVIAANSRFTITADTSGTPDDLGDFDNYVLVLQGSSGHDAGEEDETGLLFSSSNTTYGGSAIVHQDTGAGGIGDLSFYTKQATGAVPPVKVMTLSSAGKVGINDTAPASMLVAKGNLSTNLPDSTSVISDGATGTNRYVASTSHGLVIGQAVKIDGTIYTVADLGTDAAPAVDPLEDHFILDSDHGSPGDKGQATTDPSLFKVLTGDSKTALEVTAKRELVMETLGGVDAFAVRTANGISDDCVVEICPGGPGNGFLKFYSNTNEKLVINCDSTYSYFSSYSDMYFQTETNSDILFFPNGTGRVAIGTDAPGALFHVTSSDNESCCKVTQTHEDIQATAFSASTESDDRGPALLTATHATFDDGGNYGVLRIDAKAAVSGFGLITATSNNGADMQFQVLGDGVVSAGTDFQSVHGDYAEYFETTDGNALAAGLSVVLEGGKVRAAQVGEQPMGVVRPPGTTSVVGNNPWNHWKDRYLRDDFGGYVKEAYTVTKWIEEVVEPVREGGTPITRSEHHSFATDKIPSDMVVPDSATVSTTNKHGKPLMRQVENPDYDESLEYVKREHRDEWVIVGLLGQVPISKGQPLADSWVKLRDVSDSVEMYFIK